MEPEAGGEAANDMVMTHERYVTLVWVAAEKYWGVQVADVLAQPVSTNAAAGRGNHLPWSPLLDGLQLEAHLTRANSPNHNCADVCS